MDLSERELEIIDLVAQGLTNQEIGERLMISKRTVDNHVSNVFTKTGAKNRVALLNWPWITARSAAMASTAATCLRTATPAEPALPQRWAHARGIPS